MALSYISGTDLAFDTDVFRSKASEFSDLSDSITSSANSLDKILTTLKESGWTTKAGELYYNLFETSWKEEMIKYADYMEELDGILCEVSGMYENLVDNNISKISI